MLEKERSLRLGKRRTYGVHPRDFEEAVEASCTRQLEEHLLLNARSGDGGGGVGGLVDANDGVRIRNVSLGNALVSQC